MDAAVPFSPVLEVPPSVRRVLRFLADIGGFIDGPYAPSIGVLGRQSSQFADRLSSRGEVAGTIVERLKVRHGVLSREITDFVYWLRQAVSPVDIDYTLNPALDLPANLNSVPTRFGRRRPPATRHSLQEPLDEMVEDFELVGEGGLIRVRRRLHKIPTSTLLEIVEDRPDARAGYVASAKKTLWPIAIGASSLALSELVTRQILAPQVALSVSPYAAHGPESLLYPSPTVTFGESHRLPNALLAERLAQHRSAGSPRLPTRDVLGGPSGSVEAGDGPVVSRPASLPFNPLLGQMTVVSPPLRVANPKLAGKGAAVGFDLQALKKGAGQLTPDNLRSLKAALPVGTQALYPALPPDSLGPSAVNLPLAPKTIDLLFDQGYGQADPSWSESVAALSYSTPAASNLVGNILPQARPQADQIGFEHTLPGLTLPPTLDQKQRAPSREGVLDFLGLPVHMAPSPYHSHELPHRQVGRLDMRSTPSTTLTKPTLFASLQQQAFPHFQTITATPHAPSWKAAPTLRAGTDHHPLVPRAHAMGPSRAAPHLPSIQPAPAARITSHPPQPMIGLHHPTGIKPVLPAALGRAGAVGKALGRHDPPKPALTKPATLDADPHKPRSRPRMPAVPSLHPLLHPAALDPLHKQPKDHSHVDHAKKPEHLHGLHPDGPTVSPLQVGHLPMPSREPAKKPATETPRLIVSTGKKPEMPRGTQPHDHKEDQHLLVQASPGDPPEGAEKPSTARSSGGKSSGGGREDAEISLLANEVWSLLKRRLQFEAQRSGHH